MAAKRAELQAKNTQGAKRRLKTRRRREARHHTHVNHKIAKTVVAEAQRTGRGISIEDLGGIRERVRLHAPQRARLHSWAFAQLGGYLAYKAKRAGIALVMVDPAYTSQTCQECGYVDRKNRPNQATFICRACGVVASHADIAAARVIASRGPAAWAAVNRAQPSASGPRRCGPNRSRPGVGRRNRKTRTTEEPRDTNPVLQNPVS
ncbi:MAG: IS200/IS605 family element transposase accessory protein TnpB [Longispora sp.]|nr:IS200/IS605 family element transposase accessory protein TnpB [Longispora sp. (in: high G+C Gram-positive bacteria)]